MDDDCMTSSTTTETRTIALHEYDDSGALAPGSGSWATDLVAQTDETYDVIETIAWDHQPTTGEIEHRHDVRLGNGVSIGIGNYETQWSVLPDEMAATRTVRIYCDPYFPGLGWSDGDGSGAYGPELGDAAEAHVALLELRNAVYDEAGIESVSWDDNNGGCLTITGLANHPIIAEAR